MAQSVEFRRNREKPAASSGHRSRLNDEDSVRGPHQGQQSTRTAPTGRTHDCKRPLCCTPNDLLPGGGHPHMKRREFITLLGGAAAAWPLAARAQVSQKRPLIAWLGGATRASSLGVMDAFRQGMRELGYVEGGNFDMVYRYADGYAERLPALAQELVRLKPDVILAPATGQTVAAKKATRTIPIVTPALADAVHLGLIASDARPGGNVTGSTPYVAGLPAKQLELAREVVPDARHIGVLNDANDPKAAPQWQELQAAARTLAVLITAADVHTPDDLVSAIQSLADQKADVVIVLQTTMLLSERRLS